MSYETFTIGTQVVKVHPCQSRSGRAGSEFACRRVTGGAKRTQQKQAVRIELRIYMIGESRRCSNYGRQI